MEGLLKVLNSKGIWKDRMAVLSESHFTIKKLKATHKNGKDKVQIITLISIRFAGVQDGVLKITTSDDVEYIFKSENIHHWLDAIQNGTVRAHDNLLVNSILASDTVKSDNICGVLKKKSHNKLVGCQVRSCPLFLQLYNLQPVIIQGSLCETRQLFSEVLQERG